MLVLCSIELLSNSSTVYPSEHVPCLDRQPNSLIFPTNWSFDSSDQVVFRADLIGQKISELGCLSKCSLNNSLQSPTGLSQSLGHLCVLSLCFQIGIWWNWIGVSKHIDIVSNPPTLHVCSVKGALVCRVNGELWELLRPLEADCELQLLGFNTTEGKQVLNKDILIHLTQ